MKEMNAENKLRIQEMMKEERLSRDNMMVEVKMAQEKSDAERYQMQMAMNMMQTQLIALMGDRTVETISPERDRKKRDVKDTPVALQGYPTMPIGQTYGHDNPYPGMIQPMQQRNMMTEVASIQREREQQNEHTESNRELLQDGASSTGTTKEQR
jgi:hypothetical protein